jgi:hypothetical protein
VSGLLRRSALFLAWVAALASAAARAAAPKVEFHEAFIRELSAKGPDLADPLAVFSLVFGDLPKRITVYPSEGYYYFAFRSGGELVRGNIRLPVAERDSNGVSFAYFFGSDASDSARNRSLPAGLTIGPAQGLRLRRTGPFAYAMRWRGRSVRVSIYDASIERARPPSLYEGEELVGPSFDESGVRFWLLFNRTESRFYYVRNALFPHVEKYRELAFEEPGSPILIGTATGFAYLRDESDGRMYLIGVARRNVVGNTYYDGPFDQLPDAFADPEKLRDMIVLADPSVAGELGPYGHFLADPNARYAIAPYLEYSATAQLQPYRRCVASKGRGKFFDCLTRAPRPAPAG